jgi:hypothetical protein
MTGAKTLAFREWNSTQAFQQGGLARALVSDYNELVACEHVHSHIFFAFDFYLRKRHVLTDIQVAELVDLCKQCRA